MYRILLIGMSCNIGGIETYLYNLVKNADRNKFKFSFLYPGKGKMAFEDELINMGIKVYKLTSRKENRKKHRDEIKSIYKNERFDCIHYSIMSYSWYEPITLAKKSNIKIILHSHNAGPFDGIPLKTRILNYVGMAMTKRVKCAHVSCGVDAGRFLFKGREFEVFNNGIDVDKFKFDFANRADIRKELNVADDVQVIGNVAKLEEQKNPLFLVDMFYEYQKKKDNSALILVGEGSLEDDIRAKINNYNIEKKVFLLGKRIDTYKIYSAIDIYIMPSLYEGFSISLVEAQVNGLKCYTSNNVKKESNISGNVEFLSLKDGAKHWANCICKFDNIRDNDVLKKIPDKYNSSKSYDAVYKYFVKYIERKK